MLTLFIRNEEDVAPEVQRRFVLRECGGIIGRASAADWHLPDSENHLSARHCEIRFREGGYALADTSTNGAFLNGATKRMEGEHKLTHGDFFRIGRYEIVADFSEEAPDTTGQPRSAVDWSNWQGRFDGEAATDRPRKGQAPASSQWEKLEADNAVDWAAAAPEPPVQQPAASLSEEDQLDAFLAVLGLERRDVPAASTVTLLRSAKLLKRLVAGLMAMVKARARAKIEMGAETTGLELEGNNPLKLARSPEQALGLLISASPQGFLDGERAVEQAFEDLQTHQMAMLRAMQAALRSTLARFSPTSIRERAESRGVLAKIVPTARDAALWQDYEREFSGVAEDADAAFVEMFAQEFSRAYEAQARRQRG